MIKTLTAQMTHHQMIQTLKDKNIKISLQKQQTQNIWADYKKQKIMKLV